MKKFLCVLFLVIIFNCGIVFAGTEIPDTIRVKMGDNSILELDLDTYLYGVVQSEMGLSYKSSDMKSSERVPLEALKAQAVASRSYAVYNMLSAGEDADYHVTATTSSQVYKNTNVDSLVKKAVDETSGQVITYDDEVACAYFFSTSGGHTEAPENVWTAKVPYLQAVEDPYEIEVDNKTTWVVTYTKSELEKKFPNIGEIESVDVIRRSESDSVVELRITGSKGKETLLKNGIRMSLGTTKLKSQWFDVEYNEDEEEAIFEGRGFGHRVGMSQNGAIGMALEGYTYDEILKWYYTDIEILDADNSSSKNDNKTSSRTDINKKDEEVSSRYEEKEIEKPLLDKLTVACTTNWLLTII